MDQSRRKLVLLPDSFVAGMELKRSQTQDAANWTCVVHCCVRRKSVFDQRRATPVEMCSIDRFIDSTIILTNSIE